jgi:hypothetical protein
MYSNPVSLLLAQSPTTLMHFSHLVTGSKIQSRQKSSSCTSNYLQTTTSTSSLPCNQPSPKCCISSKNTRLDGPAVPTDMTATCTVWDCNVMLKDRTLQQIICCGQWSSTWEVTVSMIMRKWKLTFVNGCECNVLTSDMTKCLNSCQDGRNACKCSELFRTIILLQCNIWSSVQYMIFIAIYDLRCNIWSSVQYMIFSAIYDLQCNIWSLMQHMIFSAIYDLHLTFKFFLIYFYKPKTINCWASFKYTDYSNAKLNFTVN